MAPLAVRWAAGLPARLNDASSSIAAVLVGTRSAIGGSSLLVLDWILAEEHPAAAQLLPQGLEYVGVLSKDQESALALLNDSHVAQLCQTGSQVSIAAFPATGTLSYVLSSAPGTPQVAAADQSSPGPGLLDWAGCSVALLRCQITLPLDVYLEESTSKAVSSNSGKARTSGLTPAQATQLQQALARARVTAEQALTPTSVGLLAQTQAGVRRLLTASSSGSVQDLASASGSPLSRPSLTLSLVSQQPAASDDAQAPVLEYQPLAGVPLYHSQTHVHLDVLLYVPTATPLSQLLRGRVLPALLAQLAGAVGLLGTRASLDTIRAYHFLPPGRSHHITLLYPRQSGTDDESADTALASYRTELHKLLCLPPNRPAIRLANALTFDASPDSGTGAAGKVARLRDVHVGLNTPVSGAKLYLVDGSYEYYHYMQDRFNDAGWGCAYRSLQTIVSWFRLQQYTSKPVPSHKEIQQTLVKIGDKAQAFVGSSNWIGAIELSYILDEYLGVTSKIITINKGSEIPNHARELAAHFTTHGTPVMIGGGVLAYTLLGVAFNELTGDCAFLILDPHYTGGEDLKKIQNGTWVWWKKPGDTAAAGGPLFVQDAFYNFLCPQRPSAV